MSYIGRYKLNPKNIFETAFSYGIYREDTPSEQENSDNDIQNINFRGNYKHIFSDEFEANIAVSSRFQNFVYLKSQFSSGNFTQRSLKLNPFFYYRLKNFQWFPNMQIAVEYLSFDFPTRLGEIRGNAKRHVYYQDTLQVELTSRYFTRLQTQYHYRETGNFNWDEFTQTITSEKSEFFTKLMVFNRYNNKLQLGLGIRYYDLLDTRDNLKIYSYSPETDIMYTFEKLRFELRGWYEYQFNNKQLRTIPNLYMMTFYSF